MSVLIWIQTVCNGYQKTTKVNASKEREMIIKQYYIFFSIFACTDNNRNALSTSKITFGAKILNIFLKTFSPLHIMTPIFQSNNAGLYNDFHASMI